MKKTLLILLIVTTCFQAQSQVDYTPFNFESGTWTETSYSLWLFRSEYEVTITGDTLINDTTYYKLHRMGMTYEYDDISQQFPIDSFEINTYAGAVRENDSKQVQFIRPQTSDPAIIYDFNFSSGDTLWLPSYGAAGGYLKTRISYLDSVEICGTFRNRYQLHFLDFGSFSFWIEGVGSSAGIIPEYDYFESGATLWCYSNTNCDCYNLITSTTPSVIKNEPDYIFPNPVHHDNFQIRTENESPFKVKIYNTSGSLVFQSLNNLTTHSINCADWPSGCYFVLLEQGDFKQTRKLIVQH